MSETTNYRKQYDLKMIRLSFIVPCYKVENYLEYCLDSLLACGLKQDEYEIVCVNDCSPDGTLMMLQKYADKYHNIKVLNLSHNIGLGGVRNIALKESIGEYVWFVDSDDAIISNNVEILLTQAENNKLDVMAFNFDRLDENHQLISECHVFPDSMILNGVSFVKQILGDNLYINIGYVWRFLYRREYLYNNNLFFPEGVCWEDTVYVPKSMIEANRIQSTSAAGYQYYFHQSSVCRVMEKCYPGKLIFEYVFNAGYSLLEYAKTINDTELSKNLEIFAKRVYLKNNFIVFLLRTTKQEREIFYYLLNKNKDLVNEVKHNMGLLAITLCSFHLGRMFAEITSKIYKFKRKVKNG